MPRLDRPRGAKLETIEGLPPSLLDPPQGLPLRAALRGEAGQACEATLPELEEIETGHYSACLRARELARHGPQSLGLVSAAAAQPAPPKVLDSKPLLSVEGLKT